MSYYGDFVCKIKFNYLRSEEDGDLWDGYSQVLKNRVRVNYGLAHYLDDRVRENSQIDIDQQVPKIPSYEQYKTNFKRVHK